MRLNLIPKSIITYEIPKLFPKSSESDPSRFLESTVECNPMQSTAKANCIIDIFGICEKCNEVAFVNIFNIYIFLVQNFIKLNIHLTDSIYKHLTFQI